MSADYCADLPALMAGRQRASALSDDANSAACRLLERIRELANRRQRRPREDAGRGGQAHIARAIVDFESSIREKSDFAV